MARCTPGFQAGPQRLRNDTVVLLCILQLLVLPQAQEVWHVQYFIGVQQQCVGREIWHPLLTTGTYYWASHVL